jgi:two-component system LytT family response regulator
MKTYSAIIVEDDSFHMEHLVDLLHSDFPQIRISKVCSSGKEALEQIPLYAPDLLFLDIDLGDMDAFQLLNKMISNSFRIIFTTAYQDWAIKAFQVNALHYLLKPIQADELKEAVDRLGKENQLTDIREIAAALNQYNNRMLAIREKTSVQYLSIEKIRYLEADESYTKIYYTDNMGHKTMLSSNNLSYFEKELETHGFLRVHKSFLVNRSHIRTYLRSNSMVELANGDQIPVARQKKFLFG